MWNELLVNTVCGTLASRAFFFFLHCEALRGLMMLHHDIDLGPMPIVRSSAETGKITIIRPRPVPDSTQTPTDPTQLDMEGGKGVGGEGECV